MSRFAIFVLGIKRNPHMRCFMDVAQATKYALRRLGHEVVNGTFREIEEGRLNARLILFGANGVTDPGNLLPEDAIIFNAEQVATMKVTDPILTHDTFHRRVVWDYSAMNAAKLRTLGFQRVVHCPVGYVPEMRTIEPVEEDIDVLFHGSMNDRRRAILDDLARAGLRTVRLWTLYDDERDVHIARAKVCLNIHYYDPAVFEIFRVSHLVANGKCVVSEDDGRDEGLEAVARAVTRYVPYAGIVEACRDLVANDEARREQARAGHEAFKKIDFTESVRLALEAS